MQNLKRGHRTTILEDINDKNQKIFSMPEM